jgi:hypothetical protein
MFDYSLSSAYLPRGKLCLMVNNEPFLCLICIFPGHMAEQFCQLEADVQEFSAEQDGAGCDNRGMGVIASGV